MSCISKRVGVVVLITNTTKDIGLELFLRVLSVMSGKGAEIRAPIEYKSIIGDRGDLRYMDSSELYSGADVAVILGGDGTILKAASYAIEADCAILGVNLGRIGYMAEVGKDECDMIARIFEGKYRVGERMALRVSVEENGKRYSANEYVLNDVAFHSTSIGRVVALNVFSGGVLVSESRGDGLIVSTPTGSTAYSMSAGGPVFDPSLECMCVTPVCSLSPAARSIVFSSDSIIEIEAGRDNKDGIYMICDGKEGIALSRDARIIISRAEKKAKIISVGNEEFFNVLRKKTMSAM